MIINLQGIGKEEEVQVDQEIVVEVGLVLGREKENIIRPIINLQIMIEEPVYKL